MIPPPTPGASSRHAHWPHVGDPPAAILPNGQFLLGNRDDKRVAALDPAILRAPVNLPSWEDRHDLRTRRAVTR